MRVSHFAPALCALAFTAGMASTPARADDPNDPAMRTAEARARDKAIIKQLNEDQLAYVRERDARYAQGWEAYRQAHGDRDARQAASYADTQGSSGAYAQARSDYDAALAQWRRDVAACRAGNYEHCAR